MQRVFFHEFNILMDRKVYLPNASGMLWAYAQTMSRVTSAYEFAPPLFIRSHPDRITSAWEDPSVMSFSSSMWNHELNVALARQARERFPNVLIVFGGPHVPYASETLLEQYPFIDVAVRSEGEVTFAELLDTFIDSRDFSKVKGLTFRHPKTQRCIRTPDRELVDINRLPSPYLEGFYDEILSRRSEIEYQVIIESNRGCPFGCAFCLWGNGIAKVRLFDLARIKQEIEWLGTKQVQYVFGADANFGMLPRDLEIAELFADTKHRTGFPHSFRVCFGKNATDRVFDTAKLLDTNGLTKGVTVSFQSTDPTTLMNIGRANIKLSVYRELLRRYRHERMRVYTELILGLPGETFESFSRGIEEVFQAGLYDQVGIFLCQVLPNTEMSDPEYVAKHGIRTQRIDLVEMRAIRRSVGEVREYEDIVVGTNSMPLPEWKRAVMLAWMAQVMHGLKVGFFVALYLFDRFGVKYTELFEYLIRVGFDAEKYPIFAAELAFFEAYVEGLFSGKPQCVFLDEYGSVSWQIEEATFFRISRDYQAFYREFESLVGELLMEKGVPFDPDEVAEVFRYQFASMASLDAEKPLKYEFSRNVPEYFDGMLHDHSVGLRHKFQRLAVVATDYHGDKKLFAQNVIWFGRRDSRALEPVTWH